MVLFALSPGSRAQIPESPTASLTPNAAGIARFGNTPVTLFTGTPEISIPLYTLKDGSLSLPISLSYHSGGVKPDERPGWVGMGWSLQAGGAITRKKNDMIDEYDLSLVGNPKPGFFYNHNIASETSWQSAGFWAFMNPMGYGYLGDSEPDEFQFSFEGYSGVFVMDDTKKWQVRSERPLKVESNGFIPIPQTGEQMNAARMSRSFSGFTLTTDEGVKYVFGGNTKSIDYSIDFASQASAEWEATSWYLTQIIHPNGDTIDFTYERGNYISQLYSGANSLSYECIGTGMMGHPSFFGGSNPGTGYFGQLLSPVYLKEISSLNATVNFERSASKELDYPEEAYLNMARNVPGGFYYIARDKKDLKETLKELVWHKLDAIDITDKQEGRLKRIDFHYINTDRQRLTLGDVTMGGWFGVPEEKYSFSYHKISYLPGYLSNETDHWGFYNNRTQGSSSTTFLDKEANPEVLTYGSLKEITYPTGGRTLFEFEPNIYARQLRFERWLPCESTVPSIAGGIRIRKITDIPGNGQPPVTKEYLYVSGYTPTATDTISSGILGGRSLYMQVTKRKEDGVTLFYASTSTSSLIASCSNSLGYHVGYSEVVEKLGDGSYTISHFTNLDNAEYLDEQFLVSNDGIYAPCGSRAAYRGKLDRQRSFSATGRLLKETVTKYFNRGNVSVYAVRCKPIIEGDDHATIIISNGTVYRIFTYTLCKFKEVITEYEDNSDIPTKRVVDYAYNSMGQLEDVHTDVLRKGESTSDRTVYRHAWMDCPALRDRHILSPLSKTSQTRNGKQVEETLNTYSVSPEGVPLLTRVHQVLPGGTKVLRYTCHLFDVKGNPVWTETDGHLNTVYLWGYDYQYPIAEIRNATPEQVKSVIGISPARVPLYQWRVEKRFDRLRQMLPQAQVTTYTYIPSLGLNSVTDPSGRKVTYYYDDYGRLKEKKDAQGNSLERYKYLTDAASKEMTEAERERIRRQGMKDWMDKVLILGTPKLQPGESRTFWVDEERFPCEYRWNVTGDTANITYEIDDTFIRVHNKKKDGSPSSGVTLRMDLVEDGKVVASSRDYPVSLDPSKLQLEVIEGRRSETDATYIMVANPADGHRLGRIFFGVEKRFVGDHTPQECQMENTVRRWTYVEIKPKGEYYLFTINDMGLDYASQEIPIEELFPLDSLE